MRAGGRARDFGVAGGCEFTIPKLVVDGGSRADDRREEETT